MDTRLHRANIVVKKSAIHGYGVFAEEDISKGDIIEECYTVILDDDAENIKNYAFTANKKSSMVLGYGSIYNHSTVYENADYEYHPEKSVMVYTASRDIKKGDEILISYGESWFSQRCATERKPSWRYRLRKLIKERQSLIRSVSVTSVIMLIIYASQLFRATHG